MPCKVNLGSSTPAPPPLPPADPFFLYHFAHTPPPCVPGITLPVPPPYPAILATGTLPSPHCQRLALRSPLPFPLINI